MPAQTANSTANQDRNALKGSGHDNPRDGGTQRKQYDDNVEAVQSAGRGGAISGSGRCYQRVEAVQSAGQSGAISGSGHCLVPATAPLRPASVKNTGGAWREHKYGEMI